MRQTSSILRAALFATTLSVSLFLIGCADDDGGTKPDQGVVDQSTIDQSTIDQSAVDQSAIDQATPDATQCSVVGKWKGSGDGAEFFIEFRANGKSDFSIPNNSTGGGGGSWTLAGDKLTWDTDRQDCDGVVGEYTIKFSADCNSLTFTLVKDECTARKLATDGSTFPRVP